MTEAGSGSSGGKSSAAAALVETEDAFLGEERALDVLRLRLVLKVELVLVIATAWLPPIAMLAGQPVLVRAIALVVCAASIGWAFARAQRPGLDETALARVNFAAFLLPAIVVSLTAASTDGIVSPIAHADLVLLAAHALALPRPARRSAPMLAAIALSWPLGVLAVCALQPTVAAQLSDPRLRADFQETAIAIAVGALLAGTGQDIQWSIRRAWLSARHARSYRIESILGEGGMGVVYRALHPTLGRAVALKKLPKAAEPDHAARFVREVRATAELVHPNIVRLLDCGVSADGEPFYTMELLEGFTLHALVSAEGALPLARASYLVRDAARALETAHTRGLVHRDVKPENLFVASEGGEHDVVKLLDFGIAKTLLGDGSLTAEGALLGTPRYMAPEQAVGESVDPRTDVYALGAVLYFALAGRAPVEDPSVFAVLAAHAAGTIVPLDRVRADVPPDLLAVVTRCLSTDREARFATAGALADALEATGLPARHVPSESAAIDEAHREALATHTTTRRRGHDSRAVTKAEHG